MTGTQKLLKSLPPFERLLYYSKLPLPVLWFFLRALILAGRACRSIRWTAFCLVMKLRQIARYFLLSLQLLPIDLYLLFRGRTPLASLFLKLYNLGTKPGESEEEDTAVEAFVDALSVSGLTTAQREQLIDQIATSGSVHSVFPKSQTAI